MYDLGEGQTVDGNADDVDFFSLDDMAGMPDQLTPPAGTGSNAPILLPMPPPVVEYLPFYVRGSNLTSSAASLNETENRDIDVDKPGILVKQKPSLVRKKIKRPVLIGVLQPNGTHYLFNRTEHFNSTSLVNTSKSDVQFFRKMGPKGPTLIVVRKKKVNGTTTSVRPRIFYTSTTTRRTPPPAPRFYTPPRTLFRQKNDVPNDDISE